MTTAAFSVALLVSALTGIRVGKVIDHRGPRTVMTAGSVLGVLSLLVVAAAPDVPVFIAGWALAGVAMASTFYQPALGRTWAFGRCGEAPCQASRAGRDFRNTP